MSLIRILFVVIVSCSVFAEKPFVDMTFPQALEEAKKTGKLVMIDFYTTWCGPCKLLDKTTWKDETVDRLLEIAKRTERTDLIERIEELASEAQKEASSP